MVSYIRTQVSNNLDKIKLEKRIKEDIRSLGKFGLLNA
jgi:hypothetical protein